jgi:hypothetical protein
VSSGSPVLVKSESNPPSGAVSGFAIVRQLAFDGPAATNLLIAAGYPYYIDSLSTSAFTPNFDYAASYGTKGVAVSADGAYVADGLVTGPEGQPDVALFQKGNATPIETWQIASSMPWHSVALSPDGSKLFVVANNAQTQHLEFDVLGNPESTSTTTTSATSAPTTTAATTTTTPTTSTTITAPTTTGTTTTVSTTTTGACTGCGGPRRPPHHAFLLRVVINHARPVAGRKFWGLMFRVLSPAARGITSVKCDAKIAGKRLRARQRSYYSSSQHKRVEVFCRWRIPADAGGKRLRLWHRTWVVHAWPHIGQGRPRGQHVVAREAMSRR